MMESKKQSNKKLHVAFFTLGSRGDVQPVIVLGKGLIATGRYDVTIQTHFVYEKWVKEHGIAFSSVPGDPSETIKSEEGQEMLARGKSMEFVAMMQDAFSPPFGPMEELIKTADVVVSVTMTADACFSLCEKYNKLYIRMGLMPLRMSREKPTIFALKPTLATRGLNMVSHFFVASKWWNAKRKQLYNDWRTTVLGLEPIKNRFGMVPLFNGYNLPYVLAVSPSVYPPCDDFNDNDKVTGFLYWDTKDTKHVPEGLEKWLAQGDKPFYFGFGSMVAGHWGNVMRVLVETIERCGIRGVICSGWSAAELGSEFDVNVDSKSVFCCSQVPHAWLFPQCAGVVHHGGVGTTAAGLRAGVPTAICSMFADQPFWGMHVHSIGVGAPLLEFKDLSTERLSESVRYCQKQEVIDKAAVLGESMKKEGNGLKTTIAAIEGFINDPSVPRPTETLATLPTTSVLFHFFPKEYVAFFILLFYIIYTFLF